MKALVTGGTGFIGSSVVRLLLENGHTVRLLTRRKELPLEFKGKEVEGVHGDLKDFSSVIKAMDGMDLFYHIGEIKNVNETASRNNVKLMKQIIAAVQEKGVRRLIFISSLTVAGIPSVSPAVEETKPEIVLEDHYTSYKRACEGLLLNSLAGRCVIIRPAPVYGPGSRYLPRFIYAIEKFGAIGFPFIGNAKNIAPLIYIKDLANAIYLSGLAPSASGQIINLTDGIRHSWHDFLNTVAAQLGKKLRIMPIPPLFLKIPAVPFDLLAGIVGIKLDPVQYVNYFSKDLWFDNTKAQDLLGWRPEYSLDDGVGEMIKFYRGV
ncbi:MAG: NAD(P)-dependent oxidoreductase [Nitrospiraceae bacterium]|nr:NAD(P)-dependent oxidoreductase [Nitrospiraceae bacterium]